MQDHEIEDKKNIKLSESDFLNYWKNIDIIKNFNSLEIEGILDQTVRKAIIDILSKGKEINIDGESSRLHVMNANQLLETINKKLKKLGHDEVKKSNLYFHLQKLEENKLIQTVGYIPSGNRLISYYGRTARVFLINQDDSKKQENILTGKELPDLMKSINQDLTESEIKQLIDGVKSVYKQKNTTEIQNWIKKYEQQLRQSDIDIRHLHNLFYKILVFDDQNIKAMREFALALDLDIDS